MAILGETAGTPNQFSSSLLLALLSCRPSRPNAQLLPAFFLPFCSGQPSLPPRDLSYFYPLPYLHTSCGTGRKAGNFPSSGKIADVSLASGVLQQLGDIIGKHLRISPSVISVSDPLCAASLDAARRDDIARPSTLVRFSRAPVQHLCTMAFSGGFTANDADPWIDMLSFITLLPISLSQLGSFSPHKPYQRVAITSFVFISFLRKVQSHHMDRIHSQSTELQGRGPCVRVKLYQTRKRTWKVSAYNLSLQDSSCPTHCSLVPSFLYPARSVQEQNAQRLSEYSASLNRRSARCSSSLVFVEPPKHFFVQDGSWHRNAPLQNYLLFCKTLRSQFPIPAIRQQLFTVSHSLTVRTKLPCVRVSIRKCLGVVLNVFQSLVIH